MSRSPWKACLSDNARKRPIVLRDIVQQRPFFPPSAAWLKRRAFARVGAKQRMGRPHVATDRPEARPFGWPVRTLQVRIRRPDHSPVMPEMAIRVAWRHRLERFPPKWTPVRRQKIC
jgi:hypothetical protein